MVSDFCILYTIEKPVTIQLIAYLTQWLECRFHTAKVIGSNPIVGKFITMQFIVCCYSMIKTIKHIVMQKNNQYGFAKQNHIDYF